MHYLFLFLFIPKVFISCLVIFSYHSVAMKSSQICRPANLFKKNSATGVFLQTLRIFSEMAFLLKTREWLLLFSVLKSFLNILGRQMCCQLIYPEAKYSVRFRKQNIQNILSCPISKPLRFYKPPNFYFFFCFERVLGSAYWQTHAGDLRTKQDNKTKNLDSQIL